MATRSRNAHFARVPRPCGKATDGTQLSDGEYTIEVSATDAGGDSVYGYTTIVGQVDGVDSTSGEVLLTVGGVTVSFESVIGIRA